MRTAGGDDKVMRYKLIIFDIDGTITKPVSSWRYLHERLNLWDTQAAAYQKNFLAGSISYRRFCQLDAAHWKGFSEERLRQIFKKVPYSKNAVRSIKKLKKIGFKLVAFSTGLQFIPERIKKELGFDYVLSNRLIIRKSVATGGVRINIAHGAKAKIFKKMLKRFKVKPHQVITIGDSAGDIPLAKAAGYSIAFNSSSSVLSKIVDYDCGSNDFGKVFEHIINLSPKNSDMMPAAE